jgi:hypothetical protein
MSRSKIGKDAIAARRGRIAAGRLRGMTLGELAAAEGIHKATASRDLQAIRQEWRQFRVGTMEEMQNQTVQRYDTLLHAIWDRAEGGDLDAIHGVLAIEGQRRKMLGLDTVRQERVIVREERRETAVSLDTLMAELPPEIVVMLGLAARTIERAADEHDATPQVAPPTVA